MDSAAVNATYRSGFIEAISVWVEASLCRLQQAPYYTLMADECTDVATLEEMSIFNFLSLGGKWLACRTFH